MSTPLRVLLVEDVEDDANLLIRELERGGYTPEATRVDTPEALQTALREGERLDLVLSDYSLPTMDGMIALSMVQEYTPDVPLILVSGTLGEETAVAAMKAGAHDYVLKSNLARLVPAVDRAIRESYERGARRRVEEALRWDEALLRAMTETSPLAFLVVDHQSDRVLYFNHRFCDIWGIKDLENPMLLGELTRDEVMQACLPQVTDPETFLESGRAPEDRATVEDELAMRDGRVIRRFSAQIRDAGDRYYGRLYIFEDITARKQAEELLQLSHRAIEGSPDQISICDTHYVYRRVNEQYTRVHGLPANQIAGKKIADLLGQEVFDTVVKPHFDQCLAGGEVTYEAWLTFQGVGRRFIRETYSPLRSTTGEIEGVIVIGRDITDRKVAEQRISASEQRLLHIVENLPAGAVYVQGEEILINRAIEEITGYGRDELHTLDAWFDLLFGDKAGHYRELYDSRESSVFAEGQILPITRKDGELRLVEFAGSAGADSNIWLLNDATDRVRAEERRNQLEAQLRQAQKMEALGTLAGGIAHDFNNILLAIFGYAELTRDELEEETQARRNMDQILNAAKRAQTLVKQILAFSRQSDRELKTIDLHDVMEETLSLLRATLPSTIEIRHDIEPNAGMILADAGQVHQVILNLGSNAAHAMRESGGVLEFQLRNAELTAPAASKLGDIMPGSYFVLSARDTGHGMDRTTRERIFDPFFTTKGIGEGTGLGLSVVHGILAGHGGAIDVRSSPGEGTEFLLYFPVVETDSTQHPEAAGGACRGSERVLLVDDEEQLATLGSEMLRRYGYDVTVKTSSDDALESFTDDPDGFDVVVTDQTMPSRTGLELAKKVREMRPAMPIVLATGYSEAVTPESVTGHGIGALVMKPYGSEELARAVRDAVDHAAAQSSSGR